MAEDFSRLSESWVEWATRSQLRDVSVSTDRDDCQIAFRSRDYSFYLRTESDWWVIDTVDDRGQRSDADAKFSAFALAEKYLIWTWITNARSSLASGPLGATLYKQGYAPGIEVTELNGTHGKLCLDGECAILILGTATIFSHIMLMSVDEIEQIGRQGGQ
jgi:hypothetical protein